MEVQSSIFRIIAISLLLLAWGCQTTPQSQSSPSQSTPSSSSSSSSESSSSSKSSNQSQAQSSTQQTAGATPSATGKSGEQQTAGTPQQGQKTKGAETQSAGDGTASGQKSDDQILSEAMGVFDKAMEKHQGQTGKEGAQTADQSGSQSQQTGDSDALDHTSGNRTGNQTGNGANTPPLLTGAGSAPGRTGKDGTAAAGNLPGGQGEAKKQNTTTAGGSDSGSGSPPPLTGAGGKSGQNGNTGTAGGPRSAGAAGAYPGGGTKPGDETGYGGSPGTATGAEQVGQLDRELDDKLGQFDTIILQGRRAAKKQDDENGPAVARGGGDGEGYPGDGGGNTPPLLTAHSEETGNVVTAGQMPDAEGDNRKGEYKKSNNNVDIPKDIPDGSDDDIVARQLREAAMKEQDPELRKKLWDEYRKYKKGVQAKR